MCDIYCTDRMRLRLLASETKAVCVKSTIPGVVLPGENGPVCLHCKQKTRCSHAHHIDSVLSDASTVDYVPQVLKPFIKTVAKKLGHSPRPLSTKKICFEHSDYACCMNGFTWIRQECVT